MVDAEKARHVAGIRDVDTIGVLAMLGEDKRGRERKEESMCFAIGMVDIMKGRLKSTIWPLYDIQVERRLNEQCKSDIAVEASGIGFFSKCH